MLTALVAVFCCCWLQSHLPRGDNNDSLDFEPETFGQVFLFVRIVSGEDQQLSGAPAQDLAPRYRLIWCLVQGLDKAEVFDLLIMSCVSPQQGCRDGPN